MPYKSEYFNKERKPPAAAEPVQKKLKPRKRLRAVSKKRAMLNAIVNPGRKGFVLLAEKCMICEQATSEDCHEICRGQYREAALKEPRLWLAVCRLPCHDALDDTAEWTPERQIAYRLRWELSEIVLAYQRVTGRSVDLNLIVNHLEGII